MTLELDEVRKRINLDEPDYDKLAATLGSEAVPILTTLVDDKDSAVASKATYLLSKFSSPDAKAGIRKAARSHDINVRIAAAAGLGNVPAPPKAVLRGLLADADPGVRKVALRSVQKVGNTAFRDDVQRLAKADQEQGIRSLANEVLKSLEN